jgi:hypothetical protein
MPDGLRSSSRSIRASSDPHQHRSAAVPVRCREEDAAVVREHEVLSRLSTQKTSTSEAAAGGVDGVWPRRAMPAEDLSAHRVGGPALGVLAVVDLGQGTRELVHVGHRRHGPDAATSEMQRCATHVDATHAVRAQR